MHFEHRGFGYQSAHNYAEGWKSTFLKLNKLLMTGVKKESGI
jgi:hypothetical protein